MPIPGQTLTIRDPGLGVVEPAPTNPCVLGCSSAGTANVLVAISSKATCVATFGQGPLPEAVCRVLDQAGGPVYCMRGTGGVAATVSAVAKIGTGTGTVTIAGQVPFDAYEVILEIVTAGTLNSATFRFSLDDGNTYSGDYLMPSGGTFLLPNTNVTVTFVPGAGPVFFAAGDTHSFDCTAPYMTTANVNTACTALRAITTEYPFILLAGRPATAAAGATMFGTLETEAASFAAVNRYLRWIMDAGIDTEANVRTSMAAVDDARVMVCYGTVDVASSKSYEAWGYPAAPTAHEFAARAARELASTDLARVMSGSIDGALRISHDENLTENLDVDRISTTRTLIGRNGFYFTNGRLKSAIGSDFRYWQHGRIMDILCREVFIQQQAFLSMGVRTNSNGTIDERDASRLETIVNEALRAQLTQPLNAEGTPGHVSSVAYAIDRTNNVLTTNTLQSTVACRPLGYTKTITTQVGYALETALAV